MELLEHVQRAALGDRRAIQMEGGIPSRDPHAEPVLDLSKIGIQWSAQMGQAQIVRWCRDEDGRFGNGLATRFSRAGAGAGSATSLRSAGRGRMGSIGTGAGGPRRAGIIR